MQSDDFRWFVEHYSDLFSQYGASYLAISNKQVLGSFDNAKDAVKAASSVAPFGEFIVQLCNGCDTGYTNYVASTQINVI